MKDEKYTLKNGNIYDISTNKIIKKNTTKICGIIDVKSNIIYGYNKKKHPKKKCYIDFGFEKNIIGFIPIQQFIYSKNLYATLNFSNEISLCDIIGYVGDYESEKKYIKSKCISNWDSNEKYKLKNITINNKNDSRVDLTNKKIFSIDPPNCRDIDDAIHIEKIENNVYEIGIHIVDVSDVIEIDSKLDNEISKRGKTIYLEDETINMIPDDIMNELSLVENKTRKTFSTIFNIDCETGDIINYHFCKSLIKNNKNMTYDDAQYQINKKKNTDLYEMFMIGQKIYNKMYVEVETNENIIRKMYDVHTMIEILMIITNMVVAETIVGKYPDNVILRTQNKNDKIMKISHDFINNKFYEKYILLNKNRAMYVVGSSDTGHDDMQLKYYTHFTSPLRRYIDIINHRLLYGAINDEKVIYQDNYLNICIEYYNTLYKWYNHHERYYNNINKIYEIYKNENNKIVNGNIIGFVENDNVYAIVYISYLDNIFPTMILSKHAKKIIEYEMNSEYFKFVSDVDFKLSLFDNVLVEICICILSKNKIHIKFIDPDPYVMYKKNYSIGDNMDNEIIL